MILIDTTPLVALVDRRDSHHAAAMKDLEELATAELALCEAVLVEACFHLPARSQRDRLHGVLNDFHLVSLPEKSDRVFRDAVFHWLGEHSDHSPDWADGCIAVLSGRDRKMKVWTYDRVFRTIWRRPDGTAIPMAVRP